MGSRFEPIDRAMRAAVDDGTVAGAVAVAAAEDGVVYEGAFGKADERTGAPMALDTVFWLLSMTKAFTVTACMQLVEQGRLRSAQNAAEILPRLASPMVLEGFDAEGLPRLHPATRPITVGHLLTHTSGYTYPIWSEALLRYENVTGMPNIATCRNGAFDAPLEFEPGERWQYGIGIDWIGKIVEAVTDTSLEVYFREHLFAPLGMRDSGFLMGSEQKRRVATCYHRRPDGSLAPGHFQIPQRPEFFSGGGGAFSTPRDYLTFLRMLLGGGSLNGVEILRPQTVAAMMANQIGDLDVQVMRTAQPAFSNDCDPFPGQPHKWGYSFDVNERPGPHGRSAGSNSWAGLLNCYFWLDPTKHVTGALFTQILPFFDARVVALYGEFERGLYDGLKSRVTR